MVTKSAATHTASELTFQGKDRELVAFTVPSKSQPGRVNTVVWDTVAREAYCDCTAATMDRECWHVQVVETAYLRELGRQTVARFGQSDAQLQAIGRAARAIVNTAKAEGLTPAITCPLDWWVLVAAAAEYREREARRRDAAVCAALDISYSDLVIDPVGYGRLYDAQRAA